MTPTRESLDEAARAAGFDNWASASKGCRLRKSLKAHAATLDRLHGREPVDPDVEAVKRIIGAWCGRETNTFHDDGEFLARALAAYKAEKGRT